MPASESNVHADHRATVSALMDRIATRVHGLADTGTALCLSDVRGLPEAFVEEHAGVLKSLVVVLDDFLKPLSGTEPCKGLVADLAAAVETFADAMRVLARFRAASDDELRGATGGLEQAYRRIIQSVEQLGDVSGCPVPYLASFTSERRAYYQNILRGLFDTARAEREMVSGPAA